MPPSAIDLAVQRFNAEHAIDYRSPARRCFICQHRGCFGPLPGNSQRWACFSANHPPEIGVKGSGCYTGDALDIAAHQAGVSRVDHLRALGYLDAASARRSRKHNANRARLPRFLPPPPREAPIPEHPDRGSNRRL